MQQFFILKKPLFYSEVFLLFVSIYSSMKSTQRIRDQRWKTVAYKLDPWSLLHGEDTLSDRLVCCLRRIKHQYTLPRITEYLTMRESFAAERIDSKMAGP
ncbi:Piso0_003527 [Millerozyma farinosa CBS 7064]|uniref:Piso0_003527 protein n=1 Tax=Pichia sorbitophila (strain ATCC MYA-4447 / BCRC 22081 / CBS 7064 / NBRC 10061 / NRRL Y-12695) TaxID=559304 RepID=G8YJB6_PICSO|nr:Piso0_003527 [Millerozyma farinosa CBS 7064]CCE81176.1 Piso0_003527 [Millerozyma farinosa CBS 7064]